MNTFWEQEQWGPITTNTTTDRTNGSWREYRIHVRLHWTWLLSIQLKPDQTRPHRKLCSRSNHEPELQWWWMVSPHSLAHSAFNWHSELASLNCTAIQRVTRGPPTLSIENLLHSTRTRLRNSPDTFFVLFTAAQVHLMPHTSSDLRFFRPCRWENETNRILSMLSHGPEQSLFGNAIKMGRCSRKKILWKSYSV